MRLPALVVLFMWATAHGGGCEANKADRSPDSARIKAPDFVERASSACRAIDRVEREVLGGVDRGARVGEDTTTRDGLLVREWERAAIVQNAEGCAFAIHGPPLEAYRRAGNIFGQWLTAAPAAPPVFVPHPLGPPTTDVVSEAGVQWIALARGFITHRAEVGAFFFWGPIADEWRKHGGPAGLGLAVRDMVSSKVGPYDAEHCDFEKGSVWWRPLAAAAPVVLTREVSRRWEVMDAGRRAFLWPTTFDGDLSMRRVEFEGGGVIYARPSERAKALWGPIKVRYQQLGGHGGALGHPESDQELVAISHTEYVRFRSATLCRSTLNEEVWQVPSGQSCDRNTPSLVELPNYPLNEAFDWSEQMQGVAHDATNWFFTTATQLWRIPVTEDLENVRSVARTTGSLPAGYDHLGDLDHRDGLLYVPLLGSAGFAVGVWSAELTLNTVLAQPGQSGDSSWLAFNPLDGKLYGSTFDASVLHVHQVIMSNGNPVELRKSHDVRILRSDGSPLVQGLWRVQGGAFSPTGILYLAVEGYRVVNERFSWNDESGKGVIAIDPRNGRIVSTTFVESHPSRLCIPNHGCFDDGEELEGLDFWDLDDGRAPGVRGQLHLLMIDNDYQGDELFFKHFTAGDPGKKAEL